MQPIQFPLQFYHGGRFANLRIKHACAIAQQFVNSFAPRLRI